MVHCHVKTLTFDSTCNTTGAWIGRGVGGWGEGEGGGRGGRGGLGTLSNRQSECTFIMYWMWIETNIKWNIYNLVYSTIGHYN